MRRVPSSPACSRPRNLSPASPEGRRQARAWPRGFHASADSQRNLEVQIKRLVPDRRSRNCARMRRSLTAPRCAKLRSLTPLEPRRRCRASAPGADPGTEALRRFDAGSRPETSGVLALRMGRRSCANGDVDQERRMRSKFALAWKGQGVVNGRTLWSGGNPNLGGFND
jgi:hypothetical protein